MRIVNLAIPLLFLGTLSIPIKVNAQTCECRPGLVSRPSYDPNYRYSSWENSSCAYRVCTEGAQPTRSPSPTLPQLRLRRTHFNDGTPYISGTSLYIAEDRLSGTNQLNVRSGPGLQYMILDSIAAGTQISLTGRSFGQGSNRWVELPNGNWVNTSYLSPGADLAPTDPDRNRILNFLNGTN